MSKSAVGPLREASALLEDAWALSYAGKMDGPSVLALYAAASSSQAASGGMGKYLLLLPVLNGIRRMASLLYTTYPCREGAPPALSPGYRPQLSGVFLGLLFLEVYGVCSCAAQRPCALAVGPCSRSWCTHPQCFGVTGVASCGPFMTGLSGHFTPLANG